MPAALRGPESLVFLIILMVVLAAVGVTAVLGLIKLIEGGWFPLAARVLTAIGGGVCAGAGFNLLTDYKDANDTAGAILAVGGLTLFAVSAMRVWASGAVLGRGDFTRSDRDRL